MLFHPKFSKGYDLSLKDSYDNKDYTLYKYYKYRCYERNDNSDRILLGNSLTQQWFVDQWTKIESNNLNYIQTHQNDIRMDTKSGLYDAIKQDIKANDTGKKVILPASFISK